MSSGDENADSARLTLRPLTVDDETEAHQAQEELASDGFSFLLGEIDGEPWARFVARLERQRHGLDLADGFVPATFLVADVLGRLVGRVSIRHELNDFLRVEGGHIGYSVRPQFRRRGYATQILRQSLDVIAALGIDRALVTCDDGNAGSATVIERCGGLLEDVVEIPDGLPKRRYWIDVG